MATSFHPSIPVLSPSFLYHPYIPTFKSKDFSFTCIVGTYTDSYSAMLCVVSTYSLSFCSGCKRCTQQVGSKVTFYGSKGKLSSVAVDLLCTRVLNK